MWATMFRNSQCSPNGCGKSHGKWHWMLLFHLGLKASGFIPQTIHGPGLVSGNTLNPKP